MENIVYKNFEGFHSFSSRKFSRSKTAEKKSETHQKASSLAEFVSLIASLVLLLAELYQSAPFINVRIKAPL